MIGLGFFTHPIGGKKDVGTPLDLKDLVRKVCFSGIIQNRVDLSGFVQNRLDLSGKVQKSLDFKVNLRLDC